MDSTFATPINTRPHEHGVDLVAHSATKYLGGHNDVLGGVVSGAAHLSSLVRDTRSVLGSVLDPHAAFLIARGLKTLAVRVERQNVTALAVARALEKHQRESSGSSTPGSRAIRRTASPSRKCAGSAEW